MDIKPLTEEFGSIINLSNELTFSEKECVEITKILEERGAILFTCFNFDIDEFELFCKKFGPTPGYRDVFTGRSSLGFHSELTYTPFPPDVIWFYCIKPAITGGETKICDGIKVLAEMDEDLKKLFYEKTIKFIHFFSREEWQMFFQVATLGELDALLNSLSPKGISYEINDDETLSIQYVTSAIRRTKLSGVDAFANTIIHATDDPEKYGLQFSDGTAIPDSVIDKLKVLTDRLTILLKWNEKEFAMIDNSRVMHGRKGYSDAERLIKALHTDLILPNCSIIS